MSEKILQLNEGVNTEQIKELVRGSVEETLSEMYLGGVSVRPVFAPVRRCVRFCERNRVCARLGR